VESSTRKLEQTDTLGSTNGYRGHGSFIIKAVTVISSLGRASQGS
jgi:hypothetical protein